MATKGTSHPRLSAKIRDTDLRATYTGLTRANLRDLDGALAAMCALVPNPRGIAEMPGVPTEGTLSRLRTTGDCYHLKIAGLIRASIRMGLPIEHAYRTVQFFEEVIESECAAAVLPVPQALLSDSHFDAEQDVARDEALVNGDRRRYEELSRTIRNEIAAKKAALLAVTRRLAAGDIS